MPSPKSFAPTDEQRRQVEAYAAYGIAQPDICKLLAPNARTGKPIDVKTLLKYFRAELDTGMLKANAKVAESLFRQAVGAPAQYDAAGNVVRAEQAPVVSAAIFWAKARMNWSERSIHEHTGKDGGPIQHVDLTKLSDAQLAALEPVLAALAGAAGGDAGAGAGGEATTRRRG